MAGNSQSLRGCIKLGVMCVLYMPEAGGRTMMTSQLKILLLKTSFLSSRPITTESNYLKNT